MDHDSYTDQNGNLVPVQDQDPVYLTSKCCGYSLDFQIGGLDLTETWTEEQKRAREEAKAELARRLEEAKMIEKLEGSLQCDI